MLRTTPLPELAAGTPLMGGWRVGATLPRLGDGLFRAVAEKADGRRAVLEAGMYTGPDLMRFLDDFVEDVELWADTHAFLPVLAAGRVSGTQMVVRIVKAPRGRVLSAHAARSPGTPAVSMASAVRSASSLAQALASAHARGLVHGGLEPGRVHLLHEGVEVEPGGFAVALSRAAGEPTATRADDVWGVAELLRVMLGGRSGSGMVEHIPESLEVVMREALHEDEARRPDMPDLVAALRHVASGLTPSGSNAEPVTPTTANRTVTPRLGVVDVTLPPAAPPAPEVRSVVPAGPRTGAPEPKLAVVEKRRRAVEYVLGVVALVFVLYVAWWFLA